MPIDFKASQVRTSKIIATGSATRPYLLIYPSGAASNDSGGLQNLTGTGSDAWLFISGANGTGTDRVVFGGAVFVSGGMIVNRQAGGGGPTISGNFATGDFLLLNSSAQYLMFGDVSSSRVGIDSGAPSGTLHIGDGAGATPGLVVDDTAIVNYGRNGDNVATFMVRGASNKHEALFVVSASQERIGIRQYNPKATLDISGSVMVTGSMYISGTIFAQEFHTNIVSSSIIYDSGSTKFGDSPDDIHQFTGSAYFKNNVEARTVIAPAFSGSLTKLDDGTSYLIAGSNITITSGSSGAVTIASTAGGGTPGGPFFTVQYNNAGALDGSTDFVFAVPGNRVGIGVPTPKARLHVSGVAGDAHSVIYTGSLLALEGGTGTVPGNATIPLAIFGVSGTVDSRKPHGSDIFFYVSGNITPKGTASPDYNKRGTTVFGGDVVFSGSLYGGSPLKINSEIDAPAGFVGSTSFQQVISTGEIASSASMSVKSSQTGLAVFNASNSGVISGSSDFLVGGNIVLAGNIASDISEAKTIFSAVTNNITIGSAGSTAIVGNLTTNGDITVNGNDIKSSTATVLQFTGSNITTSGNLITSGTLEVKGASSLSGSVWMPQGMSGSLTRLTDGTSYLVAGSNVTITSASNGAVTISSTGGSSTGSFNDLGSKFVTTASVSIAGGQGTAYTVSSVGSDVYFFVSGSTGAGSGQSVFGGNLTVSGAINATSIAIGGGYGNTGTNINPNGNISSNGIILADSGFSGSLTRLSTGGSYIIASNNMSVTSASNGAITLAAVPQGSNNQIQFNASSNFGASNGLWYDNSLQRLYVTGGLQTSGDIIASADTARIIFGDVVTNAITLGGAGSRIIAGGNDIRGSGQANTLRVGVGTAQILFLSGGASTSVNPINYLDTNFHVSGSIGSRNTTTKGTATFGGDVIVSGGFAYSGKLFATKGVFVSIQPNGLSPVDTTAAQINDHRYVRFTGNPTANPTCNIPAASSDPNRVITVLNDMAADALIVSSSNSSIIGRSNTAWTYQLAAAGNWIEVVSDGTAWIIVNGGIVPASQ